MNGDILMMSQEELKRVELIKKAIGKEIGQWEVAKLLGVSQRQVRRIVRRVKDEGSRGVIHRARGQENCRRFSKEFKSNILRVYVRRYKGFGASLACEKLSKQEGIDINRETLRRWLLEGNYVPRRRIKRKHRSWRERKAFYGEMVQMDGSHHDWLEGRGPRMVLMGYIDDATNRVFGFFYEYEGTIPAMDSFKRYCLKYGVPQSVYLDRHTTYKSTKQEQWQARVFGIEKSLTEFERALKELGVRVIHAYSAPAKGRVERLFRTLQDRLVKELRLANAKTMTEANEILDKYLIEHNQRYLVAPLKQANLHRRAPRSDELRDILCIKKEHPLRKDFTVAHENRLYQILQWTSAQKIEVQEHVDGSLVFIGRKRQLKFKEVTKASVVKRERLPSKAPLPKKYRIKWSHGNWATINRKPILS